MTLEEIQQQLADLAKADQSLKFQADDLRARREELQKAAIAEINRISCEEEELAFHRAYDGYQTMLNERQARCIWAKAWEDKHSSGYRAVESRFIEIADVCLNVIKLAAG